MKLLTCAIAYLSVVTAMIVAAVLGLSSIEPRPLGASSPILASSANDEKPRAVEGAKADADRVPVWIEPTAKYDYTPVPVDQTPKRTPVIGQDARAAMARARSRPDGRLAIERALGETRSESRRALGFTRSRDNDPFFRD